MSLDDVILLVVGTSIAVAIVSYLAGQEVGGKEALRLRRELLGVGTVWVVGEDGRLHEVREDMGEEVES